MNAIKKKLQTLKIEKELAVDRADACEQQSKEANRREERLRDQVKELEKKLAQMKSDLEVSRHQLSGSNASLEDKERAHLMVSSRKQFSSVLALVAFLIPAWQSCIC